ncbi:alpha/beta hydrolase fold [hydrothermal vent metagenome]|uniref:Alpha/beta hydrolase fold n=1 Tax=hydrothermal vent metagenome TaxID=652676 RepID=A0A160TAC6_9ZZZZ
MTSPKAVVTNTDSKPLEVKSVFYSDGVQCAASLFLPEARAETSDGLPAILMVHGWGGVQGALTGPFIAAFIAAGYAVMTFDYPGWGSSEGLPRNCINPIKRVGNVESALTHLKQQSVVDAKKIVLWGTSFGGGHVVDTAAQHPELLGAIAQVPMLDGQDAVKAIPLLSLLRFGAYGITDCFMGRRPIYIPVVSAPGEFGSMDRDGAEDAMNRGIEIAGIQYDNRVAARSVLTIGMYRPIKRLAKIKIPTLLIGASRDSVAPFNRTNIENRNKDYVQTKMIDANHFEPYFEPVLSQNLQYQLEFLHSLSANKE